MDSIIASEFFKFQNKVRSCTACRLCETRTHVVFGAGNIRASGLMIVGEAPGAEEDLQGLPFVGRSGDLLNKALEAGGLCRPDVFISNILKCRPPNNRDPLPDEVAACRGYLNQQIDIVKPKLIVALGRVAAGHLLGREVKITRERGRLDFLPNDPRVPVLIVYHPSYVLRNRGTQVEKDFFHDILTAKELLYGHVSNDLLSARSTG